MLYHVILYHAVWYYHSWVHIKMINIIIVIIISITIVIVAIIIRSLSDHYHHCMFFNHHCIFLYIVCIYIYNIYIYIFITCAVHSPQFITGHPKFLSAPKLHRSPARRLSAPPVPHTPQSVGCGPWWVNVHDVYIIFFCIYIYVIYLHLYEFVYIYIFCVCVCCILSTKQNDKNNTLLLPPWSTDSKFETWCLVKTRVCSPDMVHTTRHVHFVRFFTSSQKMPYLLPTPR